MDKIAINNINSNKELKKRLLMRLINFAYFLEKFLSTFLLVPCNKFPVCTNMHCKGNILLLWLTQTINCQKITGSLFYDFVCPWWEIYSLHESHSLLISDWRGEGRQTREQICLSEGRGKHWFAATVNQKHDNGKTSPQVS